MKERGVVKTERHHYILLNMSVWCILYVCVWEEEGSNLTLVDSSNKKQEKVKGKD